MDLTAACRRGWKGSMPAPVDPIVRQLLDRLIVPALVERFLREHRTAEANQNGEAPPISVELPPIP
jgi:hypothetical protein